MQAERDTIRSSSNVITTSTLVITYKKPIQMQLQGKLNFLNWKMCTFVASFRKKAMKQREWEKIKRGKSTKRTKNNKIITCLSEFVASLWSQVHLFPSLFALFLSLMLKLVFASCGTAFFISTVCLFICAIVLLLLLFFVIKLLVSFVVVVVDVVVVVVVLVVLFSVPLPPPLLSNFLTILNLFNTSISPLARSKSWEMYRARDSWYWYTKMQAEERMNVRNIFCAVLMVTAFCLSSLCLQCQRK